jgi:NAD(P)H-dependent FMN reductase
MPQLHVIIASTRPQRVGPAVAKWFVGEAERHGKYTVNLIDLKEVNLPLFDEPKHPRFQQYEHAHTQAWSRTIEAADAFVFVTPEYNYGMPPSRAVQMLKQTLTSLKIMPLPEAVSIPFVSKHLDSNGVFDGGGETQVKAATAMLDELWRWSEALKVLRQMT